MIKPEIVHVHFLLLRYKLKDRLRYLVSYLHLVLSSGQISGFTKYCLYFNTENWLRWVWDSIAIWSKILLKSPPLPFPTTTFSSSTLPCKTKVGQKSILAMGQSDGVSHHHRRRRGRRRSWSKWSHPEGNFGDGSSRGVQQTKTERWKATRNRWIRRVKWRCLMFSKHTFARNKTVNINEFIRSHNMFGHLYAWFKIFYRGEQKGM